MELGEKVQGAGCPVSVLLRTGSDPGPRGSREAGHHGKTPSAPRRRRSRAHSHRKEDRTARGRTVQTGAQDLRIYLMNITGAAVGRKAKFPDLGAA